MQRKKLASGIALALAGSVGPILNTAQAVHIDPDGLGQVLLFPYYGVRNGTDTLVSVVNTTERAKAVKVRFLEGKNGRDVLDFSLYLSPFDVWICVITQSANGGLLLTSDRSCTVPPIPATGVEFRNFGYTGDFEDGEDDSLNRTREGHVEIIEMGELVDDVPGDPNQATDPNRFQPATAATHVGTPPVPTNCSSLNDAFSFGGVWLANPAENLAPLAGGLAGGVTLIDARRGTAYGYDALALDRFASGSVLHTLPGGPRPSLDEVTPKVSVVFEDGSAVTTNWSSSFSNPVDPISALLMHDHLYNQWTIERGAAAGTDWIVTFPTKRFYVGVDDPEVDDDGDEDPNDDLFEQPFTDDFWLGGACEEIVLVPTGREEERAQAPVDILPPAPGGGTQFCWEVNVLTFDNSSVLSSELEANIANLSSEFGWLDLGFLLYVGDATNSLHQMIGLIGDEGNIHFGLPALGFALQEVVSGNASGGMEFGARTGGLFDHLSNTLISGIIIDSGSDIF